MILGITASKSAASAPPAGGWDISAASFVRSLSVGAQETTPLGLFFKPDGLKLYVTGLAGDDVNEYTLTTAWDLSSASFTQASANVGEGAPQSVNFKPDGTKMYIVGQSATREFNLSAAWDVSTISFVQSITLSTNTPGARQAFFTSDGLSLYIVSDTNDSVTQYSLSTAWNISTTSFIRSLSVSSLDTALHGLWFKPDGTKMFVSGLGNDQVHELSLSTAWDISTATAIDFLSVSAQDANPRSIIFDGDGTRFYFVGTSNDAVYQYSL